MSERDPEPPHEIVIVRRKSDGDHDEHHGGVWKVAFADFMTAMMAFFLVLWIVNSTTKQTRSSLARYFNPIRLSDTTPARKGLNDPREVDFDASATERQAREAHMVAGAGSGSGKGNPIKESERRREESGAPVVKGEPQVFETLDEFKDPFARRSEAKFAQMTKVDLARSASKESEAIAVKKELGRRLGAKHAADLDSVLDVTTVSEGILISLTEGSNLGSFGVGSSQPDGRHLKVLAAIAEVLKTTKGSVVGRGHTDSRTYRDGRSDNWTLSFARAQAAFFGLVRSGLDERRVERVEGHADRKLKNAHVPEAPENRRIEILLRRPPGRS